MKIQILFIALLLLPAGLMAQKVDYKSGTLSVDGKDIAMINRIKDKGSFGLTGTYELFSLSGRKLVIATLANNYEPDRFNNGSYFYKLTFLTTGQDAIFTLSKLGPEKSFAKLIGGSGIIVGDSLSKEKVTEFIALKSKNPPVVRIQTELYHMIDRDRTGYIELMTDQTIQQARTVIGSFKDVSQSYGTDVYEFSIPAGLVIATVSFNNGSNSQDFVIKTLNDNMNREVHIPAGKDKILMSSVDRNESALLRIVKWLVQAKYL